MGYSTFYSKYFDKIITAVLTLAGITELFWCCYSRYTEGRNNVMNATGDRTNNLHAEKKSK